MLRPHLPALLLLLMSAWSGTFFGAVRGVDAFAGHLTLVGVAVYAGGTLRDPLRLGRAGNLFLLVLILTALASFYASPVPRAGRLALVLAPGFLFLPRFVALAWPDAAARRHGLVSLALVFTGIAGWGMVGRFWLETPGASLPLGHHNLLAAWLVTLLPLAVLPWRDGGAGRLVAGLAALVGVTALALTGSLAGTLALGGVVLAGLWTRHRAVALTLMLLALLSQAPRWLDVARGEDLSARARQGYAAAAIAGVGERPLLGWGPGAANWTLARFLEPRPGVHPPGQVVADPHSLPLRLGYELGLLGLFAAIAVAVSFVRRQRRAETDDPTLARAALLGLLAFFLASLAGRTAAAPALPFAAALMAGAALAAKSGSEPPAQDPAPLEGGPRPRPAFILGALMVILLLPHDLAHLAYDEARTAPDDATRRAALDRAIELDPAFPLYSLRRAALDDDPRIAARRARAAAEEAGGVAWLWLAAGRLGQQAGEPWSEAALLEACALAPLGALAPFRLASGAAPGDPRAPAWAERAILAQPLLLAATAWRQHGDLLARSLAGLHRIEGVDPGFLWEIAVAEEQILAASGARRVLVLEIDGDGATSPTLHAFRRLPWPAYLDEVEVFAELLPYVTVEPAAERPETAAAVFAEPLCQLPRRP